MKTVVVAAMLSIVGVCALAHDQNDRDKAESFTLDNRGYNKRPYSHLNFANDPDDFQFVIVSDNTGGARPGVFRQAMRKVNLLRPEFVVSVGDLIEGFTENREIIDLMWDEFNGVLDELEMPFFYTPGNHDWSNDVMGEVWKERFGASTYHFVYKDVLFLVLNSEESGPGGTSAGFNAEQVAYVKQTLANNTDVRWTMVFTHQPVWAYNGDISGWGEIEEVLAKRDYTAFAGHMHTYAHHSGLEKQDHFTLGSTGGESLLRGKIYGEFDHVTWVSMLDSGPRIANLSLDGIDDKYVVPEKIKSTFAKTTIFSPSPWYSNNGEAPTTATVTITNPFDGPLSYSLQALSHAGFAVNELPSGILESGETRTLDLKPKTLSKTTTHPFRIIAKGSVQVEVGANVEWTEVMQLQPTPQYSISPAPKPISFDGKLDEWVSLPFESTPQAYFKDGRPVKISESDLNYKFGVSYDDNFFYVGIRVIDDEVTLRGNSNRHSANDFASITFDGRQPDISARNPAQVTEMKEGKWMFLITAPNEANGEVMFRNFLPPGLDAMVAMTDSGYEVEFRIPLAYAQRFQGKNWRNLRLNISVNDVDATSRERMPVMSSWQQSWQDNIIGSGMFFRARK